MKKHINIPIFIPHLGCPNQCVFCNQKKITGINEFDPESVRSIIDEALSTVLPDTEAEIAFFGGSFTGIDRNLMIHLLEIANSYMKAGRVRSIRCSTRPDYIDENILDILQKYGVKVIELGLQSVSDEVLTKTKRGHLFSDEKAAVKLIVERGFDLIGQMMIGLPSSTLSSEIETARFICESGAVGARIYPTVVFKDTELCQMSIDGKYSPIPLEDAIKRSAEILRIFYSYGVKVIRIGLCASENLSSPDSYYAGPNHPALGELVENRLFYLLIKEKIEQMNISSGSSLLISVPLGALSKAIGQNKTNKLRLISEFCLSDITFLENKALNGYNVECEERKDKCI